MNIKISNLYKRDLSKLKIDITKQLNKAITLLKENPYHPSLHNKPITCKRADNMYSIRVNKNYRVLYFLYDEYIELHRLLDHDKYDRLTKDC